MRVIMSAAIFLLAALIFFTQSTDAFLANRPAVALSPGSARVILQTPNKVSLNEARNARRAESSSARRMTSDVPEASTPSTSAKERERINNALSKIYSLAGILSAFSWIATAYVALSFHPDPKFADCTLRHNVLTMSQAFAFPLPVAWAAFEALRRCAGNRATLNSSTGRRLNLGVAAASLWLAASMTFPPAFAFGYDLYSRRHKLASSVIHGATGTVALALALRSTSSLGRIVREILDSLWNLGPKSNRRNGSAYATGAAGLLYFSIQPVVSPYPLATIPTILGKRLSRPASAFTLLGAVLAYCLKESSADGVDDGEEGAVRATLRKGLAWGTTGHLCLILAKIIGLDGGGLILPGRGLWEVYPAMIAVPFAAGVSFAVHAIFCFGAWTEEGADDTALRP